VHASHVTVFTTQKANKKQAKMHKLFNFHSLVSETLILNHKILSRHVGQFATIHLNSGKIDGF
jgi:hypothetical protein